MKRLLTVLLCLLMLTPLIMLLPFDAAAEATVKFTVADKNGSAATTFVYGEPIMITPLVADGGGSWIGIAPKGKVAYGSYRSKMITKGAKDGAGRVASTGLGVNVAFDIRTGAAVEARFYNAGSAYNADIGPGEWTIFYVAGGYALDYDTTSTVDITVTAGPMTVTKTEFAYGEPIPITAAVKKNPTHKSWYGIVPDVNGSPKYTYGTIINRTADGTEDDLRDYSDSKSGTVANNTKNWANYFGISKKQLLLLPAGTYWLVYCEDSKTVDGGAAVTHKIQIKIKAAFTTDKTAYAYGEPIKVTVGAGLEKGDHIFIAPKHEDMEQSYYSIRWHTLTESTTTFNIRNSGTVGNYPHLWELPPGDYSIFAVYAPNSKAYQNDHGTRVDITVSGEAPKAPTAAVYDFDKATGLAGGTLTVTLDETEINDAYGKPTHIITYWGDENGQKLTDYTYIGLRKITGVTTVIDIPTATVIPDEARTLLVHAYNGAGVSEECFTVTLPTDRKIVTDTDKGALLSSFQIVSDIHTQDEQTNQFNKNIAQMLADIKANDPDSVGVFVAGDAVNDGRVAEYENLYDLWLQAEISTPIFIATGNHEWKLGDKNNSYTSDYKAEKDRFIEYANKLLIGGGYDYDTINNGKPYYDLWVNGFHYIFLASEHPDTHAFLSTEQLNWLKEKLEEDRDVNRPTFILLHQALYNTVDGGMPRQDWDGVVAGDENIAAYKAKNKWHKTRGQYEQPLRDILAQYPEAMMFSGHSHWDMTEYHNYYDPNDPTDPENALPNYLFNTAAVAYLSTGLFDDGTSYAFSKGWYDQTYTLYGETHLKWNGSKGYYVRVYENCIEVYGREFSSSQWVPNAMYRISKTAAIDPHDHTYDNSCDENCNICGDIREVGDHQYDHGCDTNCNVCNAFRDIIGHQYDNDCDTACNECGAVREVGDHQYDNDCDASCNVCNAVREVGDHQYDHACQTNCNECGALRVAESHQYDNDCDTNCNICDAAREVGDHTYDNACDAECNSCGAAREVGDHTYDNACDAACNSCGDVREVEDHQYDNACDTDCNICHTVRTVEGHARQFACSLACYHCGEPFDTAEPHTGREACSEICIYCEEKKVQRPAGVDHRSAIVCSDICGVCGEPTGKQPGDHKRLNPCSNACEYCSQEVFSNAADHVREFPCSTSCKNCDTDGLERLKEHENKHPCSRICKYCEQPVAPDATAAHQRQYECSTSCKICGEQVPQQKAHERIHPCSEVCKYCSKAVIPYPADHDRGADCSTSCTVCGVTMPRYKEHEGIHPCTKTCMYCEEPVVSESRLQPHQSQYSCSTACKICGESITPLTPHERVSACLSLCKHCNRSEFVANDDHVREFECSDTCRYCHTAIGSLADHESAHACSRICIYCYRPVVATSKNHQGEFPCSTACAACGAALPSATHTYGAWQMHNAFQHKKVCACGDAVHANHAWDEGAVTAEPTAEAVGERTYTCTDCNATKSEEIAKLPTTEAPSGPTDNQSSADSNANASENGTDTDGGGIGTGAVVAIALGGTALVGGGGFAAYWFTLRKKKRLK